MSFPRAKIQRFNDITNPTPSPADYNTELKKKATGAVIAKRERFTDTKSPALSEISFVSSTSSTPCFRTPNPPKSQKHIFTKTKSVDLFKNGNELEALKDKIVECTNKDQTIKELTEQIEDMKIQLNDLETSVYCFNNEKEECQEKIKALQSEHETTVNDLMQKHEAEVSYYVEKLPNTELELKQIKDKYDQLKKDNRKELVTLLENINKFEKLYDSSVKSFQEEVKIKNKEIEELNMKHKEELEKVKKDYEEETIELLKNMTDIQKKREEEWQEKIKSLEKSQHDEINKIKFDTDAEIKQIKENYADATKLCEIQMKEKCAEIERNFILKLELQKKESNEILKECQAISEYNIIQGELEKSHIKKELSEKNVEYESLVESKKNMENDHKQLQNKLNKLEMSIKTSTKELEFLRNQLHEEIAEHKKSIRKAENDKKAYDLALSKSHRTIEALKKRLLHSDQDVELLKSELETTENSKLEIEECCYQLFFELQTLYKNVEVIDEKLQKETEDKIKSLKEELLQKIEDFKFIAQQEKIQLVKKYEVVNQHLKEQMEVNKNAHNLIEQSSKRLEKLDDVNEKLLNKYKEENESRNYLKEKLSELVLKYENLIKDYECDRDKMLRQESKLKEADLLKKEFEELNKNYEDLLMKMSYLERRNEELEKKILEQESLIGPFRDQLLAYEMEYKVLVGQKTNIENEAKEMGLQYAKLLGHQNQKQKIKYVVDVRKKNFELAEIKEELEKKLRSQTRLIEKLKRDLEKNKTTPNNKGKSLSVDNKENQESPSGNPVASPKPLKARNLF